LTNSKRQGTVVYRDYLEELVHTTAGIYHDTSVVIEAFVARKECEPETGERWCPRSPERWLKDASVEAV
jgi:hypothetical protein